MTNKELLKTIRKEIISRIDKRHLSAQAKNELVSLLSFLDTLESEKPMQEGLEEEIREYMSNEDNNPFDWDWRDKRDCARHFAEWQKEQMMKEAVEGKIIFLLNGDVAVNIGDTDKYNLGQKIRVIVLPKED